MHLKDQSYIEYLESFLEYLEAFLAKSQPLIPQKKISIEIKMQFERGWNSGNLEGWNEYIRLSRVDKNDIDPLYCMACHRTFANENVFEVYIYIYIYIYIAP